MTHDLFGEVISTYTRADAIADGVLVDVTETAKAAGVKIPVAVTQKLWAEFITPDPRFVKSHGQSIEGRLWDVLSLFAIYARRVSGTSFTYTVQFVMKESQKRNVQIQALIHEGDHCQPVITLSLPGED
ncbi:DUF6573 family protein [Alicyclobacillus fodiniaquatilis]|uniref:DUF6573 family protein n=1 Tax=Alicyclobacillus fodiniaquatilis TaxID=1661150 RepID=A0ABW4JJE1_9BACL